MSSEHTTTSTSFKPVLLRGLHAQSKILDSVYDATFNPDWTPHVDPELEEALREVSSKRASPYHLGLQSTLFEAECKRLAAMPNTVEMLNLDPPVDEHTASHSFSTPMDVSDSDDEVEFDSAPTVSRVSKHPPIGKDGKPTQLHVPFHVVQYNPSAFVRYDGRWYQAP